MKTAGLDPGGAVPVPPRRENQGRLDMPRDLWFDESVDPEAARSSYNRKP
ncbi:MAG: hypothetical protein KJ970_20345 [Candidatus Eisenbacteria bacterium]|uniref:Uncharacterized protein n=1 Tax=Eiseniibacteriota bacterium TaxID=2212470 RepID=A0A948RYC1_UNCEI|nr:hypothetical protein [Candidatus Eisenbacteria bacterium]MBU1948598.1 hypothetical protein [Candidatus Eisenbacteria bacterium]MBU2693275.1 hypothetical protein [Candidatus Eisenbacteria bacterium]